VGDGKVEKEEQKEGREMASVYGAAISIDRHGRTDGAISPSALAIFYPARPTD